MSEGGGGVVWFLSFFLSFLWRDLEQLGVQQQREGGLGVVLAVQVEVAQLVQVPVQ